MFTVGVDADVYNRMTFMPFYEALGSDGPFNFMEVIEWFFLVFGGGNDSGERS